MTLLKTKTNEIVTQNHKLPDAEQGS